MHLIIYINNDVQITFYFGLKSNLLCFLCSNYSIFSYWVLLKLAPRELSFWNIPRRLLRVLCTARRSHQTILKEINPEYSLEGLALKLQYFGHLMWRANSLENPLMLGKIENRRRRGRQRTRRLDGITDCIDMSLSELQEIVKDRKAGMQQFIESQRMGHEWATEQQPVERTFRKIPVAASLESSFHVSWVET